MSKDYGNWCPDVYRGLFVNRFNDDKLRIAPCCQAQSRVVQVDNFNFATNDYLTEIRTNISAGNKPIACTRCWQDEESGKKSRRLSQIEFYNIPTTTQVILEGMDYHSTWACNLACIMCSPENSSTWATELEWSQELREKHGKRFRKSNGILEDLDLTTIKRLHFNGGEPLLNNEHISVLDKLDLSDVVVSYNTNGTVYPSDELIKVWGRAKLVKLFFSIDAVESAFEYIRFPANWAQTSSNLTRMRKELPSNVMFSFNVTIGAYNALNLLSLWNWFDINMSSNREGDQSDFCYQLANNFDPSWLTKEAKHAIIKDLEHIESLAGFANYITRSIDAEPFNGWINKLAKIDQRRGTNWRKSLNIRKYYKC